MRRILIFIAFFVSIVSLIGCGGGSSSSSSPEGVNPGVPSDIQLSARRYIVQTNADAYFDARVLDGNGKPLSGVAVTFTNISPIGTISAASAEKTDSVSKSGTTVANTNSIGYATARVFSSTSGFVTVQAEVNAGTGLVRERKTVVITSSDVKTGLFPSLTLDVDSVPGNGIYNEPTDFNLFENIDDDTVEVLATVFDIWGNPVPGESIQWSTDQAEAVIIEPVNSTTNVNGQAKAIIKDVPLSLRDTVTFLNVNASAENGAFNMVSLFLQPVGIDLGETYLTADPPVVETGGTSTITAVIFMSTGEPIFDGATINFTTTCGTVTPFAQTTGGVAEATFTAPETEGTCTITAKLRGAVIGTVDVIVTSALTVLPATQTIDGTTGGVATFTIFGGLAPYTVVSDNPLFPPVPSTVAASGDSFTVTVPANTPDTTVTYTIRDAAGTEVTAELKITGQTALAVLPTTQTIDGVVGGVATYTIFGGTPSYDIFTSNPLFPPSPVSVAASGGTFSVTVPVGSAGATITYTIRDADGKTVTAKLVIIGPGALAITPDNYDLTDGVSPQTFQFQVTGGVPNYTVTSGSPAIVFNDNGAGGGTADDGIINGTEGGVWALTTDGALFTATVPANAVAANTVVTLQVVDSGGSAPVTATLTITN